MMTSHWHLIIKKHTKYLFCRLMGVIVVAVEAPMCCQYMPMLVTVSEWIEVHFRFWMRGTLYFL